MRAIAKEKLLSLLLNLPAITDKYMQQDPAYVPLVVTWLLQGEQQLQALRLPIVGKLSGLRGLLVAIDDGYQDPAISVSSRSMRKAKRALAAHVVNQAESAIRAEIQLIDQFFAEIIDKLSQLLAIRFAQQQLPKSKTLSMAYVDKIWAMLGEQTETLSMHRYIQAKVSLTDRRYLLQALLDNMLNN